jgi:type 1 glutamine amidotransferase
MKLLSKLSLAALALAALVQFAQAAEPKRVIVCTVTTGFRHASIPYAEKTLQKLADESKAFTIVDFVQQPNIEVPKRPNKPREPKPEASDKEKANYQAALQKYNAAMAAWTPEMEKNLKEAEAKFQEAAKASLARLSPENLTKLKIDGVIFANTTGSLPLPDRDGFIKWIENGHAFMAMHSGADTLHDYAPYHVMLGGEFKTHEAQVPADLIKADQNSPATQGLPDVWNIKQEEMYQFINHDRDQIHALWFLRHHPNHPDQLGYAGVSWCKMAGTGRVFYTSLGHREDLWSDDPDMKGRINPPEISKQYQQHILGGIKWALGLAEGSATPNPEVK